MSWFSKPLNKGIAIGAGVLALVAIALLIYGVVTHTEATLLKVQWENGEARCYEGGTEVDGDGECEGAEELVWPTKQIPLTVSASETEGVLLAPGSSHREGLDSAIRDINLQIGCKVLAAGSGGGSSSVVARLREAVDVTAGRSKSAARARGSKALGWATHYRANGPDGVDWLRCDLHVSSRAAGLRAEYLVAHHELLHCLGLAHTPENPSSAMYPFTYDDSMFDRMFAARITDGQRSALRRLYCE